MFLDIANNNGTRYIRISESVRIDKDGKRVTRKKTIKNIGPVSHFTDGKPDFEQRLRDSFKAGNPLLPELLPYVNHNPDIEKYSFQISEYSPDCIGHPKLYSHCLIERILEELGVIQLISSYKGFSKIQFDILGFVRLLIFGRILNPSSKIATVSQNNDYYEAILKGDFYDYNVYDALDFIYQHRKQLFNRINSNIMRKFNRNPELIFYDVTNFYFEIDEPDDDITDEDDNVIEKGIRKMGVCKEQRKLPIVQMGLFMDDMGIPISCEIFPGNTLDHLTVRDALRNSVDNMNFKRFVFVGDRGMYSDRNLAHILNLGNGYVVSKSILKSSKDEREWIYDDSGYTIKNNNFKYKSKVVTKTIKDEDGKALKINEKVVVYWDKYFYDRQIKENESFMNFLDKLLESPDNFRINKTQSKNIRKFLKKEYVNADTGEIMNASDLKAIIDEQKIKKYKESFGYYQIISSELNMSEQKIIDVYHELTKIEDQFKIMKGNLDTRPIHVRTKEHIDAHLAICTISLIVMRIIQKKVVEAGLGIPSKNYKDWTFGISAERIQNALNKWTVEELTDNLYRFNNVDDPDLKRILDAFNIEIPVKLFKRQDLKNLKKAIEIAVY